MKQLSAWQFSAAITHQNHLFVWGTGIFGEYLTPQLMAFDQTFNSIRVGGTFSVLLDKDGRTYVWGSNTNGEIGSGDANPKAVPTLLESIEEKTVHSVGVGATFAFALGAILKGTENYQTYMTEAEYANGGSLATDQYQTNDL